MAGLDVDLMRKMGRHMNDAMVDANPIEVTIYRQEEVDDGAGGVTLTPPTPLPPQTMRMVDIGSNRVVDRTSDEGRVIRPSQMFLADFVADIQQGDNADPGDGYVYRIGRVQIAHHRVRAEAFRNKDPV